jgi:hypothetical protein
MEDSWQEQEIRLDWSCFKEKIEPYRAREQELQCQAGPSKQGERG